jgi:hypothetical protein
MDIKQVIAMLNQMQADGVIDRYAIGGAVGATFYLEPVATLDVDVFVHFQSDASSGIITVKPIYDYLSKRGCTVEREYIVIAGTPVQFLAPNSPLVEEALNEAVDKDVDGMPVRVFTAEAFLLMKSMVTPDFGRPWYPNTLLYAGYSRTFELFARAASHKHFDILKQMLGVESKDDLIQKLKNAFEVYRVSQWFHFAYESVGFEHLWGIEKLDTLP